MSMDVYYHGFLVDENRRRHAIQAICQSPEGLEIVISAPTRSSKLNARMWVCLFQMSQKCLWHGLKLSQDEWKNLASSGIRELKVVPNLDGSGFVALGKSTSRMSNRMIGEIIECLCGIASQQGKTIVFLEDSTPEGRP